jgi:amino acid permease
LSTSGGIFLFASTIIGAGILALPIVAFKAGFFPLASMIVAIAAVSAFSGLYIAESVASSDEELHLPALAKRYLGAWGMIAMLVGIGIYTYGALVGYLAAGGQIINVLSGGAMPIWTGVLLYFVIGSVILHQGVAWVSRINGYLMYVMLLLLGVLISMAAPRIQLPYLFRADWKSILDVFGVVLFAFLGHSVIPSIASILQNKKRILLVVSLGIALPCALYLLWSTVVLGAVPATATAAGGASLASAQANGEPATIPLGFIIGGSVIMLGNAFAALSMLTSYMGFGVSLKDSYAGLGSPRRAIPGLSLTGLVVVPPLLLALLVPGAFVRILDIAGTFGGGLFVGVLPVLIVLKVRRTGSPQGFTTWGGSLVPYAVLAIYVFGMLYTAARLFGEVS